jgi:SP family sugar:H+ symporter-like MFS transporter
MLAQVAGDSTAILWAGQPAWRWMFWLQAARRRSICRAAGIPESPRYLVARGDDAGAQAVLTRLLDEATARKTVGEIRDSLAADHHRPRCPI